MHQFGIRNSTSAGKFQLAEYYFLERHAGSVNSFCVDQSAAQYRKFAEECRRLARYVRTAQERKVLQDMEAAWIQAAGETERKSARTSI